MSKTTTIPAALQAAVDTDVPGGAGEAYELGYREGAEDATRRVGRDAGPDPDAVWYLDQDDVATLVEPIDVEEQIEVLPRLYVEFKAHGNAEPIILSSVEARRLARALEAAATKVERGEGYVR